MGPTRRVSVMVLRVCPYEMLTESIPVIRIARTKLKDFKELFIVVVPVGLNYVVPLRSQGIVRTIRCAVEQAACRMRTGRSGFTQVRVVELDSDIYRLLTETTN